MNRKTEKQSRAILANTFEIVVIVDQTRLAFVYAIFDLSGKS